MATVLGTVKGTAAFETQLGLWKAKHQRRGEKRAADKRRTYTAACKTPLRTPLVLPEAPALGLSNRALTKALVDSGFVFDGRVYGGEAEQRADGAIVQQLTVRVGTEEFFGEVTIINGVVTDAYAV